MPQVGFPWVARCATPCPMMNATQTLDGKYAALELFQVPVNRKRGVHSSRRGPAVREMLWPSMGWRAFARWMTLKIVRSAKDPYKVAMGGAIGMWVNFLPLPGLGAVVAILIAFSMRANVPAAIIGQLPGNPWTFPIIWWISYQVGKLVWPFAGDGIGFTELMSNFSWSFLWDNSHALLNGVLLPLVLGGQVLGVVLAFGTFVVLRREVAKFWDVRRAKALARIQG